MKNSLNSRNCIVYAAAAAAVAMYVEHAEVVQAKGHDLKSHCTHAYNVMLLHASLSLSSPLHTTINE
jgi:hypothetical protein